MIPLFPLWGAGLASAVLAAVLTALVFLAWHLATRPPRTAFQFPRVSDLRRQEKAQTMLMAFGPEACEAAIGQLRELERAGRDSSVGSILLADLDAAAMDRAIQQVPRVYLDRLVYPSSAVLAALPPVDEGRIEDLRPAWQPAMAEVLGRLELLHLDRNNASPAFLALFLMPGPLLPLIVDAVREIGNGSAGRFPSAEVVGFVLLPADEARRRAFLAMREELSPLGVDAWFLADMTINQQLAQDGIQAALTALVSPQKEFATLMSGEKGRVFGSIVIEEPIPGRVPGASWHRYWADRAVVLNTAATAARKIDSERSTLTLGVDLAPGTAPYLDIFMVTVLPRHLHDVHTEINNMFRTALGYAPEAPGGRRVPTVPADNYTNLVVPVAGNYVRRPPSGPAQVVGEVRAIRLATLAGGTAGLTQALQLPSFQAVPPRPPREPQSRNGSGPSASVGPGASAEVAP